MPQRSHQTNNGERRYSNVVDLPDDLKREVEKAILRFWDPQQQTAPPDQQRAQAA